MSEAPGVEDLRTKQEEDRRKMWAMGEMSLRRTGGRCRSCSTRPLASEPEFVVTIRRTQKHVGPSVQALHSPSTTMAINPNEDTEL